jgi:hypothetical protein
VGEVPNERLGVRERWRALVRVNTSITGAGTCGYDIWTASRSSISVPFGNVANLAGVNTSANEFPSWISDDGCRLYVWNNSGGKYVIEVASKPAM